MNIGLIELSFFFGIVLAVAIWELISVRRSLRQCAKADGARERSADGQGKSQ